jgi:hypothetical protein
MVNPMKFFTIIKIIVKFIKKNLKINKIINKLLWLRNKNNEIS